MSSVSLRIKYSAFFVLVYSVLTQVHVHFVGRLMASELFALFLIFFLIFTRRKIQPMPFLPVVMAGFAILLFGLILSDTLNQSLWTDTAKGWSMVIFGFLSALFLTIQFAKSTINIYIFLAVSAVAMLFIDNNNHILIDNIADNSNYFKIRYAPILLPIIALVSSLLWPSKKYISVIFTLSCGILFLLFNARSMGFTLIVSSFIMFFQIINYRFRIKNIFPLGVAVAIFGYSSYVLYATQAINLNTEQSGVSQLRMIENPYNPLALLRSGRSEVMVAIEAVKDRPIIGYGSWAKDSSGQYERLMQEYKQDPSYAIPLGVIPKHSILVGSWVWGGIVGFIGISLIAYAMLRMFIINFRNCIPLSPVVNIYYVYSVWTLLFSPIGHIRTSYPFVIALLLVSTSIIYSNRAK